jgi:ABC-type antimicrobial peptide transport system permease subunit
VNEEAAKAFWHGSNPVGRELAAGRDPSAPRLTVIGVVASARHDGPNQPYKPELFLPYEQFPARAVTFLIEPKNDAQSAWTAFRDALKATDPLVPVPARNDMESLVGSAVALPRLYATLVGIFASAALLLAALGVYGVMAFSVAQRQRELGVRLALGAAPSAIGAMILREGGRIAVLGVVIGFAAALAVGRAVNALLFGVTPFDLPTFLVAATVLAVVTVTACLVPAIRATRVDLLSTIRAD